MLAEIREQCTLLGTPCVFAFSRNKLGRVLGGERN